MRSYAKPPCDDNGHKRLNEGMFEDEEQRVHTKKLVLKRKVKIVQQKFRRRNMKIKNMTAN